jgi:hypothetical protein
MTDLPPPPRLTVRPGHMKRRTKDGRFRRIKLKERKREIERVHERLRRRMNPLDFTPYPALLTKMASIC